MAQPPQACAPCPAHYAVLQGAYARYTNTLIVLERALYLAHANARTLLVDTQAMFPNNSKITQKYNPGTRSLADILQVEPTDRRPPNSLHAAHGGERDGVV